MRWPNRVRSWTRTAFRRRAVEHEIERELQFHLEELAAEQVESGMSKDEAEREARRQFGSRAFAADTMRDARGISSLDHVLRDVKYGARRLARDWRFTVGAVLILALGIGVNTAVFSVVNRVLFRPSPFPDSHEVVNLYQNSRGQPAGSSYPAYLDMAAYDDVFVESTAFTLPLPLSVKVGDVVRTGMTEVATASYLPFTGKQPAIGRWFDESEDREGGDPVVVLGHQTWLSRFGGSPSVLGMSIHVDATPVTIVGVAPEGHASSHNTGIATDYWLSLSVLPLIDAAGPNPLSRSPAERFFDVRARLRDGVGLPQARAAMDALSARLARDYPKEDGDRGITVIATDDVRVHPQVDALLMPGASLLMVLVGLLLAIACSNLATLLLVRGSSRAREVALRLALGASRAQLLRMLLTESVVLAVTGGLAGYLLAQWAVSLIGLADLPLTVDLSLDYRVFSFTLLLSFVTGLAFGLAPALRATRVDLVPELRNEGSASSTSRRWFTVKNGLIVGQIAASCLLLVAGGMVLRALMGAQHAGRDPGFATANLAYIETDAGYAGYERDRATSLYEELRSRIAALPGVEAATVAVGPPIGGYYGSRALAIDGYEPAPGESIRGRWSWAGPGYFETLGVPMLYGRTFTSFDRPDTPPVVVINELMARRFFGSPDAVGRRFRMADVGTSLDATSGVEVEVIGVVPTLRASVLDTQEPQFYRSFSQSPAATSGVIVRTSGSPDALLPELQRVVRELDNRLPVTAVATVSQQIDDALGVPRAAAAMLAGLGLLGLALASVGLYAVVAFAVSRRAMEIGIRMALGAQRGQVIWAMSRDVAMLLAIGLVAGVLLSWGGIGVLNALSADLSEAPNIDIQGLPVDVLTLAIVAILMAGVGLAATVFPARRAARTEAVSALRHL